MIECCACGCPVHYEDLDKYEVVVINRILDSIDAHQSDRSNQIAYYGDYYEKGWNNGIGEISAILMGRIQHLTEVDE